MLIIFGIYISVLNHAIAETQCRDLDVKLQKGLSEIRFDEDDSRLFSDLSRSEKEHIFYRFYNDINAIATVVIVLSVIGFFVF